MNKFLNFKHNQEIVICGKRFKVLSKTTYITMSSEDEYVKYILSGHKILVVIPTDQMMYLGEIKKPFELGKNFADTLEFEGFVFEQVASDYQVVMCVEFGNPQEVEGEVLWADYVCEQKPETYISCAYVPKTDDRADIVGKIIEPSDIEL